MTDEKPTFNIIHNLGEPNRATFEGVTVTRQDMLFVREWKAMVRCTPYDNHFIFHVPQTRLKIGMSEYLCTCGSVAVVAKPENERQRMFICHFEATYGYHQTTVVNKKDFEQSAGETLTAKGKKWLI